MYEEEQKDGLNVAASLSLATVIHFEECPYKSFFLLKTPCDIFLYRLVFTHIVFSGEYLCRQSGTKHSGLSCWFVRLKLRQNSHLVCGDGRSTDTAQYQICAMYKEQLGAELKQIDASYCTQERGLRFVLCEINQVFVCAGQ
jgi:hypothetical protein